MRDRTTPGAALTDGGGRTHEEECLSRQREPLPTRVTDLPLLPAAYDHALDEGLTVLGFDLSVDVRRAIDDHVRLLLAWNAAINLTAIREPVEIAHLHVLNSLTALEPVRERGIDAFVDLGSGGGFPGLPLALALPARTALLVESIVKKAAFLEAAVGLAGREGLAVAAVRAETLAVDAGQRERWPAVVARAVADLADLVELAFPLLAVGGWLVAWKRGEIDAELAAGRRAVDALGSGTIEIVESGASVLPGHRLVFVRKSSPTPSGWPRDPAVRRRRPW